MFVQKILGHRPIVNTTRYTRLVNFEGDEYLCKIARTIDEACRSSLDACSGDCEICCSFKEVGNSPLEMKAAKTDLKLIDVIDRRQDASTLMQLPT